MKKEKLRKIRKEKGITQQQLADLISTEVSNFSRKESGNVSITPREWQKIADYMNVSVDQIYEDDYESGGVEVENVNPQYILKENTLLTSYKDENFYKIIIQDLQDYITYLKAEIKRLKK
ncbi:helix-turn-helix transcriptional regulator [Chryseobacterium sp. RP-3-3]|uniref:Helix-turn-helix transcriptional regulator n=1 Tax=Chryseobacterium antibioticum TaxID=2728847 RepID=A0A7Y0AP24_9FLAO|nr:helix-turn-helix transcriptional regulator [Chryseobacterium antibioticum]NML70804.1 helix-turn-helix transcriptional regulator [Chryseobacterium antibioticum]